jgi:hypothetical protein
MDRNIPMLVEKKYLSIKVAAIDILQLGIIPTYHDYGFLHS